MLECRRRALLPVVVLGLLLFTAGRARAQPAQGAQPAIESGASRLPPGRWEAGDARLCIEIYRGGMIEVSSLAQMDRDPARLAGRHLARLTGPEEYEVTIDVRWILQKTLSRCRKYWYTAPLTRRELLGLVARPGRPLVLTFRFSERRRRLEVCGAPGHCLMLQRAQQSGQPPPADDESEEISRHDSHDSKVRRDRDKPPNLERE